ncbi:hypothetical protein APR50_10500 [Variovorax paradoxus]|jgi:hypothetical protein|uniref:Bbp16 family capsid cement protein n=1 Tax=Variovorax paradoxus TaxID=34073 RepID=UPI0006E67534|nr:hypothetical protein APR52_20750 [Variovorax paradoxus]KPV08893.1 hypothetical protein APR50_10500 [Variovorax paradoxus]KPV11390.1 hypothetical protein APR49_09375 [Variovorax paradoxus]KPV23282.1 hypothetical protein APR51_07950 [Variovorax paradoxus]KPV31152.1 hypothetical protein APR48_17655 [Variovorax paradoxus]
MILDNQAIYANAQAITSTGDTASTNSYDHGPGNSGPGAGDLWLVVKTNAAFTSGGAGTLQAVLQDSADNSSFTDVLVVTPALALAALGANKTIAQVRFPGNLRRYTRVAWRVGTAAMTAGTASAFVVLDTDIQQYLASGFKVGT